MKNQPEAVFPIRDEGGDLIGIVKHDLKSRGPKAYKVIEMKVEELAELLTKKVEAKV